MAVAFVFVGAAKPHIFAEDLLIRIGAMLASFGLVGQVLRNFQFLMTGQSPNDADFPTWMLKDAGLCLMILGYAMRTKGEKK